MKNHVTLLTLILGVTTSVLAFAKKPNDSDKDDLRKVAEQFVKVVDENNGAELQKLLHPEMLQYVQLGDKLIPFKTPDYIQMVSDKKIGGKPRKVTHKSASILRGNTANVILNAVSDEYDFMYQLSMVKSSGEWIIVGILADIKKVE